MSFYTNITVKLEDRQQYRQHVSSLDLPVHEMDAMIDIVHSILSYFVDQAFSVQTDQITLGSIGKVDSEAPLGHDTIKHHPENQTAAAENYGVEGDSNPMGPTEP